VRDREWDASMGEASRPGCHRNPKLREAVYDRKISKESQTAENEKRELFRSRRNKRGERWRVNWIRKLESVKKENWKKGQTQDSKSPRENKLQLTLISVPPMPAAS